MLRTIGVVATFALTLSAGNAALAQSEEDAIKYRQAIMKAVGGHAGAIGQIAKGEVPHADHLRAHASALNGLAMQVLAAFKANATMGETRAKDEIWSDWSGFESAAREFEQASGQLAAAAGGEGDVAAALDATFDSCKGCHRKFRAKKD